jgi:hypothetical protein
MADLSPAATELAEVEPAPALPTLVDRAAQTLASARTAAEVLEAKAQATYAYDQAKAAGRAVGRFAKAQNAFNDLIAKVHRTQADALEIEALARRRLADEYDTARALGEVAGHGGARNFKVATSDLEKPTTKDLGLSKQELSEARQIRDAERERPGIVRETLDAALATGEEPTRAAVKRSIHEVLAGVGCAFACERTRKVTTNKWRHFLEIAQMAELHCETYTQFKIPIGMPDAVFETALEHVAAARRHLSAFGKRVAEARARARGDATEPTKPSPSA